MVTVAWRNVSVRYVICEPLLSCVMFDVLYRLREMSRFLSFMSIAVLLHTFDK